MHSLLQMSQNINSMTRHLIYVKCISYNIYIYILYNIYYIIYIYTYIYIYIYIYKEV